MDCMSCANLQGLEPLYGNSCEVKDVIMQVAVLHGYGQTTVCTVLPSAII